MAIKIYERYEPNANPPDADHPQGSFKNASTPTATDGTPVEVDWANDRLGFTDYIMEKAGLTYSGVPDTALASDRYDALRKLFTVFMSFYETSYVSGVYTANSFSTGASIAPITDGDLIFIKIATNYDGSGVAKLSVGPTTNKPITEASGTAITPYRLRAGTVYMLQYDASSEIFKIQTQNALESPDVVLEHRETVNIGGGNIPPYPTFTPRPITTVVTNKLTGFEVRPRSDPPPNNEFTPLKGTYYVKCEHLYSDLLAFRSYIYNKTTASKILYSFSGLNVETSDRINLPNKIKGILTCNGTDAFEIRCTCTQATAISYNLGAPTNLDGDDELYMRTEFKKISD
jgi:hypothetical protein